VPSLRHSLIAVLLGLSGATLWAQEPSLTRKHHPWGLCAPGAWKLVRVTTKSLDDKGMPLQVCSTETRTTLTELADDGVTLEVSVIVDFGGRRFDSQPQVLRQAFHGAPAGENVAVRDVGPGTVQIEGQKVPCRVVEIESSTAAGKTLTTVYCSDAVAPYVLKRHSVTTDPTGKTTLSETDVDVLSLNMPCEVLGELRAGAEVRTVHKHAGGTTTTVAFLVPEVPGGIVSHSSKECDKSGRLIRLSVLKLVGYGEADEERIGVFGRKRSSRYRKSPTYYSPPH